MTQCPSCKGNNIQDTSMTEEGEVILISKCGDCNWWGERLE